MKVCICCDQVISNENQDQVSFGTCDDCVKLMSQVLGIESNAKKERCLHFVNIVKDFVFKAVKKLKDLDLTQDTINKILLDPNLSIKDMKTCSKCDTLNMIYDKRVEVEYDKGNKRPFNRYQCSNCGHILLQD